MTVPAGGPATRQTAPRFVARRMLSVARGGGWAIPLLAPAGRAGADESKPEAAKPDEPKPEIGFSADELEGDLRVGELVLRGHVVITYERFRLTSPELRLARTPRGITVRGWGEL